MTTELFPSKAPGAPLMLLVGMEGEGIPVVQAARDATEADFSLVLVSGMNWEDDLTPWPAPALGRGQPPFGGKADAFLKELLEALPGIEARLGAEPQWVGLAGYSLAGLFALYAITQTDAFARAASVSGSLWYPDFVEYAEGHPVRPERVYLSVGDKECRAKLPVMRSVEDNTRRMEALYRQWDVPVKFELNPGGHFRDPEARTGRGIAWLVG